MAAPERVLANQAGVVGARHHGLGGVIPADAVVTAIRPNGRGVPYYSDKPYVQPYNERPTCSGTRTDGKACKAKAEAGELRCASHKDQ